MRIRPLLVVAAAAATVATLPAFASPFAASSGPAGSFGPRAAGDSTPAWTPPLHLDGGGAEPSIRVPSDGQSAAYVSAPGPSGSNFWRIQDSMDSRGITTLTHTDHIDPDLGTGGGDSEISTGRNSGNPSGCDTIAYTGLHNIDALDNFTVASSTDCGKTFSLNPAGTQNTLTDRQWQTFDGDNVNHLLYHKVDTGQIVDSRSTDGGQTYVTLGTAAGATGVIDAAHSYTLANIKIGNVVTDYGQTGVDATGATTYTGTNEPIHALYATFDGGRDAADAAQGAANPSNYDHLDTVYLAKSLDGGVTWTDTVAYSTPATETRELDLIFPVLSIDAAGNLYEAWTDGNLIQYVVSTDHGATFSKPFTVNPGEAGAQKTNGTADLFPWIAGGADGALDVVWYHGQGDDTTGYRNVGVKTSDTTPGTNWTVAFAQLTHATARDAAGAAAPTVVSRSLAITPIIHNGNVCNNGTTCGITDAGDRTLLDFFQVAIDGAGRANIAYAADADSPTTAETVYTRQNSGNSLLTGAPIRPDVFNSGGTTCDPAAVIVGSTPTQAVVAGNSSAPGTGDDLNIQKAFLTYDGPSSALTFHIDVKALGTTGSQHFRYYASFAGVQYQVVADRAAGGAQTFSLGRYDGTTAGTTNLSTLTGAFDVAANEVRVVLPVATFNSTAMPTTPLGPGGSLTGQQVLGQRSTGAATLTAYSTDTQSCPFTIPGAAAAPSAPAVPTAAPAPSRPGTAPSPSRSASPTAAPTSATPKIAHRPLYFASCPRTYRPRQAKSIKLACGVTRSGHLLVELQVQHGKSFRTVTTARPDRLGRFRITVPAGKRATLRLLIRGETLYTFTVIPRPAAHATPRSAKAAAAHAL